MDVPVQQTTEQQQSHGGKYLTFNLCQEEYGIKILEVREIIGIQEITRVPKTPEYVRGVINLRGKVIPVIDLRLKFGMPAGEMTEQSCIIVVDINRTLIGILVDSVTEVLDIGDAQIEPPPDFGSSLDTRFILGMGMARNKIVILLNIALVLNSEELSTAIGATA